MFIDGNVLKPAAAVVPTQLSAAMACGYILWLLQRWNAVPWITQHTTAINAAIRAAVSALATVGITFSWNPNSGTVIITGLTAGAFVTLLYHWFVQYAATQGFEKVLNAVPADSSQKQDAGAVVAKALPAPAGR